MTRRTSAPKKIVSPRSFPLFCGPCPSARFIIIFHFTTGQMLKFNRAQFISSERAVIKEEEK
jgi:hypothetical protein